MIFGFLVCTPLPSPFCVAVVTVKERRIQKVRGLAPPLFYPGPLVLWIRNDDGPKHSGCQDTHGCSQTGNSKGRGWRSESNIHPFHSTKPTKESEARVDVMCERMKECKLNTGEFSVHRNRETVALPSPFALRSSPLSVPMVGPQCAAREYRLEGLHPIVIPYFFRYFGLQRLLH